MLAVAAALDDDRPRLRRVEVDQRHDRARIRQLRHERRHIFRHAGAFSIGIEVAQARVQQSALAARQRARPTSTAPASRSPPGCSRACCRRAACSGGVVSRRIASSRCWIVFRSRSSACSGIGGVLPAEKPDPARRTVGPDAVSPITLRSAASATSTRLPARRRSTASFRQPYQPSAPYIDRILPCARRSSRAFALTASIIVRQASTYF